MSTVIPTQADHVGSTNRAQPAPASQGADMIVFNANIFTGNLAQPEASAFAVRNGRIYAVGADEEILGLKGSATQMIDAGAHRVIPGINDAHMHLLNETSYTYNVRWDGVPTLRLALTMLKEQAERTPEGHWVKVIGGWSPYQFEEKRFPTMEELREAVPNRPLHVQYAYNRIFLNDLAIEAYGAGTSRFPDIQVIEFEKDDKGNYTGFVSGDTFGFLALESLVPQPDLDEQLSALIYTIHNLNRFGVTSIFDCGSRGYPAAHVTAEMLMRENRFNLRMSFVDMQFGSAGMIDAEISAITKASPMSPGQNLNPSVAHGHVFRGAKALEAEVHDHENFDRPAVILDPERIHFHVEQDIAKLVKRRIPFRMHISYNENITPFLDALEKMNETTPLDGLKWSIEHAETITPDNIIRVKKLGGGIALDPKMALHGDAFIKTYGREKALDTPRLRALVDSGVPLAMTTDAFRVTTYNPWVAMSWMVTGQSVSSTEVLGEHNRLSRVEAIHLFTKGAAWFTDAQAEMGRIAPGNLADFVVLDRDYFSVPENEIKHVTSLLTVLDGRVVFGAGDYSALATALPEILPIWSPIKYYGGYHGAK
ncbi:amidohydrolase [Pararhizobium sp. PWRC1-1]|uniref:amidohydrolase n=1 Tax=Pararhizobium sp. PWRC1-1 TaxID=2804566 RepID=UPI003CE68AFA